MLNQNLDSGHHEAYDQKNIEKENQPPFIIPGALAVQDQLREVISLKPRTKISYGLGTSSEVPTDKIVNINNKTLYNCQSAYISNETIKKFMHFAFVA